MYRFRLFSVTGHRTSFIIQGYPRLWRILYIERIIERIQLVDDKYNDDEHNVARPCIIESRGDEIVTNS